MRTTASCLVSVLLFVCHVHAQEANVFVGMRFQPPEVVTAVSARASYMELRSDLALQIGGNAERACSFGDVSTYQCIDSSYLPPFPVALPHRAPHRSGELPSFGWAPVAETVGGAEAIAAWKTLANAGAAFDCTDSGCMIFVHALPPTDDARETLLAVCRLPRIDTTYGAPDDCQHVAIIAPDQIWIKAVIGYLRPRRGLGLPDFDMKVARKPPLSLSSVLTAIHKAMIAAPLQLLTVIHPRGVVGVASYRVSPVLSGWRELVTVRIDADEYPRGPLPFVTVTISTTIYVNLQNTPRPFDWHRPSPQQEEMYSRALREAVTTQLESLCKVRARWRDAKTLLCDGAPFTPPPYP